MQIKEHILHYLQANPGTPPDSFFRHLHFPHIDTRAELEHLVASGAVEVVDGGLRVAHYPDTDTEQHLGTCASCGDRCICLSSLPPEIMDRWRLITAGRPFPESRFSQYHVTAATSLARAALILKRRLATPLKIFVLGDDDLVSIALSLLDRNVSVSVLEADVRILRFIDRAARKYDMNIECALYDAREPLPHRYLGMFHSFFADPTPSLDCPRLFLSRCIQAMRNEVGSRGYTSLYPTDSPLLLHHQKDLTNMGLLITMSIPGFAEYEPVSPIIDESSGHGTSFSESMIELTTTRQTRALIAERYEGSMEILLGKIPGASFGHEPEST
jgi:N4-bis(aminopropyl)spermidine synthase